MKTVFTLLIVFCFFLLRGSNEAHAQTLQNVEPYTALQHLQKESHSDFANFDSSILQKINNTDRLEDLYTIETEDDDVVTFGKSLPFVAILVYISLTFCFFNEVKHRLPFCKHLSDLASRTYLLQRVLRI
ncbi:hypothetical protein [Pedobacter sp. Hv1]|uniref:hypothetical protein n=1 Tax=Pedobacter sp. Hv1 TaxID=1740090 RepID=UPI0006D8C20A|nr:hypothetical protein [Pedobacter sp. Hv1]KQC01800.1 hypothetical protein AQF98_05390 [Pedobacter sp. Hv1]